MHNSPSGPQNDELCTHDTPSEPSKRNRARTTACPKPKQRIVHARHLIFAPKQRIVHARKAIFPLKSPFVQTHRHSPAPSKVSCVHDARSVGDDHLVHLRFARPVLIDVEEIIAAGQSGDIDGRLPACNTKAA